MPLFPKFTFKTPAPPPLPRNSNAGGANVTPIQFPQERTVADFIDWLHEGKENIETLVVIAEYKDDDTPTSVSWSVGHTWASIGFFLWSAATTFTITNNVVEAPEMPEYTSPDEDPPPKKAG